MNAIANLVTTVALVTALAGCGESSSPGQSAGPSAPSPPPGAGTHTHADGTVHADDAHGPPAAPAPAARDHAHDEVALGTARVGTTTVELAQGHGVVAAGKEGHLVVKLPYSDHGGTVVRAWIGTQDRTVSFVGKGTYSASRDAYDIHATAPDPLPAGAMWWIEVVKPDGQKALGSAKPITD